jgi:hypothetical protein
MALHTTCMPDGQRASPYVFTFSLMPPGKAGGLPFFGYRERRRSQPSRQYTLTAAEPDERMVRVRLKTNGAISLNRRAARAQHAVPLRGGTTAHVQCLFCDRLLALCPDDSVDVSQTR